jgi:hypothetical protein
MTLFRTSNHKQERRSFTGIRRTKFLKPDFRQEVTNQVIEMIEAGTAPWIKPWQTWWQHHCVDGSFSAVVVQPKPGTSAPRTMLALKTFHRKDTKDRMTITESAVAQRIRRKLRNTGHMLRKARGERQLVEAGRYYVIDTNLNTDHLLHVNIEAYARELGVLRAHEAVAE